MNTVIFKNLLVLSVLIGPVKGLSQTPEVAALDRKIMDFARENSQIMENLEYLCDVIGPRLTGSSRLKSANDWTAAKMKEYGLENVHLESYNIPLAWERIKCEVKVVEPNGMDLIACSQPWTPGIKGTVTGPVIFMDGNDEEAWAKYKGKLKGAIVLLSKPMEVQEHPSRSLPGDFWSRKGIGGTDETANPQTRLALTAREQFMKHEGVVAILQDSFVPQTLLAITGSWNKAGVQPPFPRIYFAHEHYSMLYRLSLRQRPAKISLKVENRWTKGPVAVYNTVGEIKGTEKPEEIVLCGAHLDSWDLAQGAVDNGTGSMVVLEAARLIKVMGLKPKRTIRFVLFSGEEQGLHGSANYVEQHLSEMEKISGVFVHDTGTGRVTGIGLHGSTQVQPIFEDEFSPLKELGVNRYVVPQMGGTDHASFYPKGVPSFWFVQDSADYSLMHHTQSDTFDKAIKGDLVQGATVMAICAVTSANRAAMLPRKPISK